MKKAGTIDPKKQESCQGGMEGNNGAILEYFIDTGGHCFLCLRGVSLDTGNKVGKDENECDCQIIITSFQDLFRYLNMELGEVLVVPKRRLKKLSQMELIVECCGDCHQKIERFAEVCSRLEKIENEELECLRELHEKMAEAEAAGRFQNLRELFESTTKSRTRKASKIVERFWIETLNKCKKRLNLEDLVPEVSVKQEGVVPTPRRSLRSSGPPSTPSALPSKAKTSKQRGSSSKGKNRPPTYRTQLQKLSVSSDFRAKNSKRVSRRPEYYSVEIRKVNKRRRPKMSKKMNNSKVELRTDIARHLPVHSKAKRTGAKRTIVKRKKLVDKTNFPLAGCYLPSPGSSESGAPQSTDNSYVEPELTPTLEVSCPAVHFPPVQNEKENEPPPFSPDPVLWKASSLQYEIVEEFSDIEEFEIPCIDLTDH